MITVLLWGDRWWLPHHKLPVPFADLAQAADQLAAAWPEKERKLRIIFHPDDFATVPTPCPNGNRATLALALAEDHPVLRHPGHVWGYEPILPAGDSFATLLHHESQPFLFGLIHRLREHNFDVASVWPMATWLNALPPDLSPTGAMTICALHSDRFLLYRHAASGERTVRSGYDGDVLTAVAAHLAGLPTQAETEYVLYVTTDDSLVEQLAERVPLQEHQVLGTISLAQALAKPVPINPHHPAQLLPPVPFITAPRLLSVISALCGLIAVGLAVSPMRAFVHNRAAHGSLVQERIKLQGEIAEFRRNETAVQHWQTVAATNAPDPLPWRDLLQTVSNTMPPQVVLTRLQADRRNFHIEGGLVGTLPEADWKGWLQSLSVPEGNWMFSHAASTKGPRDFTLKGHWR